MKSTSLLYGGILFALHASAETSITTAPPDCLKIPSDADWPAPKAWKDALPGLMVKDKKFAAGFAPDYRFQPKSAFDVQKAVRFAKQNKVRLSVVVSGHDCMGRSDAASGLLIDVSKLKGIKVLGSFTPTAKGVESALGAKTNVIVPKTGVQAAVTFGAGTTAQMLYDALSPSKLFPMTAGHGAVGVAGGWAQFGGHGMFTHLFGLGVDQWLEAKVVTADGELKIVNKVSNPDLFWAIRGGGGGNWGVLVEATMKAHPDGPITGYNWWINSTIALKGDMSGMREAHKYIASEIPGLHQKGVGGAVYAMGPSLRGYHTTIGKNQGTSNTNALFKPILEKLQTFPGMTKFQTRPYNFKNFKEFYDTTFGHMGPKMDMPMIRSSFGKRHGPDGDNDDEFATNYGLAKMDSHLLTAADLKSPLLMKGLDETGGFWIMIMAAPLPGVGDVAGTSVNPSWRKSEVHFVGLGSYVGKNGTNMREYFPGTGAYGNEADYEEPNWQKAFWGNNYAKLSSIKTKYDPDMLFWVTPGVNADYMAARLDKRVCKVAVPQTAARHPPKMDIQKIADGKVLQERWGKTELNTDFPPPGQFEGLQAS